MVAAGQAFAALKVGRRSPLVWADQPISVAERRGNREAKLYSLGSASMTDLEVRPTTRSGGRHYKMNWLKSSFFAIFSSR